MFDHRGHSSPLSMERYIAANVVYCSICGACLKSNRERVEPVQCSIVKMRMTSVAFDARKRKAPNTANRFAVLNRRTYDKMMTADNLGRTMVVYEPAWWEFWRWIKWVSTRKVLKNFIQMPGVGSSSLSLRALYKNTKVKYEKQGD